jgi:thioester reductase-like protein
MNVKKSFSPEEIQGLLVLNLAQVLKVDAAEIDITENLENYGLNSAQAMVLVSKIEETLGFQLSPVLLWHYPNIKSLSERLAEEFDSLSPQVQDTGNSIKKVKNLAPDLDLNAEAFLDSSICPETIVFELVTDPKNIFITGGTGYLGAFLIDELLRQTTADIYCLVRARNTEEGKKKLLNNLSQYGIWDEQFNSRIIPIVGDLSQPFLGINSENFDLLASKIDSIYHSAAMLNYVLPYSAMKTPNVLGTQEVLRLACKTKVKPVHYISSVAIFESPIYAGKLVKEEDDFKHWQGIFLGYSQTKWVAEKLVKIAGDRGLPITIHRPPLISGHSKTGVCNTDDFINLMVKGCLLMGTFPNIDYMLDMSPVDYVSQAIVYLSRQQESVGKAFHLQHPQPVPLRNLVDWVSSMGYPVEMISYEKWQEKLVNDVSSGENPLFTLRPFLLERFSDEQLTIPDLYLTARRPTISCEETLMALAGSSITCSPIDSKLFMIYTAYLVESGFLNVA